MIAYAKNWAKRHWPRLRLRTILFATLFLVAAMPGFGAVFLRVYENTLVRQTEAELVAQGAALSAAAAADWPLVLPSQPLDPRDLRPEPPSIDLNSAPVLPERPPPGPFPAWLSTGAPDAAEAARRLAPVIAATRRTTLASIVLLDANGLLVTGPSAGRTYAGLPEVSAALRGRSATVLRQNGSYRAVYALEWLSRAAAIRVHHVRPVIVGGHVVGVLLLSRSARSLFKGLYEDRGKIGLGVGAIFAALVVLSGLLSRGVTRPIEVLGAATNAIAAGRGSVPPVPQTAAVEIQALYRDFAAMAAAIDRRSRYLRDFAHAVSHEFKTPLAGIRGALELLRDHDAAMTPADRRRFLDNADAGATRLTLLVTRLLELARADMAAVRQDAATALAPVLHGVADALRTPGFTIAIDCPADLPAVAMPPATLERVLTALVENSRQSGAATASIAATARQDAVVLEVIDDGPGIPAADRTRVFEPFFTTRREDDGSGLGLPIVRSLLGSAGAGIDLAETPGGATFTLRFPHART